MAVAPDPVSPSSVLVARGRPGLLERWKRAPANESFGAVELIRRNTPDESKARAIQQRLTLAGYREDFHRKLFSASKIAVPALLVAIAAMVGVHQENSVLTFAIAGGLGYLSPDWWLKYRIRARTHALQKGLPDLLDLTGDPAEVRKVCDMFGVDAFLDEGLMNHSSRTVIIDRQGAMVANIEGNVFTARQLGDLVESALRR